MSKSSNKDAVLLTQILNAAPLMVFAVNGKGIVTTVKGGEMERLGLDTDECIGYSAFKLKNFPLTRAHFRKVKNGEAFNSTMNLKGVLYETFYEPTFDPSGRFMGCSGFSTNVTDRVMLEEKLDQARFKTTRMQQLNSLAGMANGIAHEINNPLAIISGYSQQIQQAAEMGKADKAFLTSRGEKLVNTAERITRIISGLQSFSREGSDDEFETQKVKDIFVNTWEIIRSKSIEAGINLDLDSIDDDLQFEVRRVQIAQAIFNLLSNCIEAISEVDEPHVHLSVTDRGESIEIVIEDNGPGIPQSHANRVWEPFFTTKGLKHAGMGLSTTKGIIESHNGEIQHLRVQNFTSFRIILPKYQVAENLEKDAS